MIRLIYFIPIWIIFLLFRTLMIALGWVLIPVATLAGAYAERYSPISKRTRLQFTWPVMWVFSNEEDGVINREMQDYFKSDKLQIIYWSAFRNPANNLRYTPYISCKIDPSKVRFIGSLGNYEDNLSEFELRQYDRPTVQWFLAWQGLYSNIFIQFKLFGVLKRFWIGFKIMPFDVYGVNDHRKHSAGFATQLKGVTR